MTGRLIKAALLVLVGLIALGAIWRLQPAPVLAEGEPADRVVIHKAARRMDLIAKDRVTASFGIALGADPIGPKTCQGDGRTPEGRYRIDEWLDKGVSRFLPGRSHLLPQPNRPAPGGRGKLLSRRPDNDPRSAARVGLAGSAPPAPRLDPGLHRRDQSRDGPHLAGRSAGPGRPGRDKAVTS